MGNCLCTHKSVVLMSISKATKAMKDLNTKITLKSCHKQFIATVHALHCFLHRKTRTTRVPAFWGYPLLPHDYPYYWVILDPKSKQDKVKVTNLKNLPKVQILEFWNKHYTWHTFRSCMIRCVNMKWNQWVLLKIQSGHDSVHRLTRQTDKMKPVYPLQLRWAGV